MLGIVKRVAMGEMAIRVAIGLKQEVLFDSIRAGDTVTILNRFGQRLKGRAVMKGPAGWVLNMGGAHGTPGIADERNTVDVRKKREASDAKAVADPFQMPDKKENPAVDAE